MQLSYSFIIPVYNRPDEIAELLASFKAQKTDINYEIVIIEDGSTISCVHVIDEFPDLNILYLPKENSGPGSSRNYGMQRATGNYFIILDSDCMLPEHYLMAMDKELRSQYVDFFGGPDAAHPDFSTLQKAISYSMTSFFTTGGIRGGGEDTGSRKVTYWFPTLFIVGLLLSLLLLIVGNYYFLMLYVCYFLLIGVHSAILHKNIKIGFVSIVAAFIQFYGYGVGFISSVIQLNWLGKLPRKRYPHLFFK